MKYKSWFLPVLMASVLQLSIVSVLLAQSTIPRYVVVGAFAHEKNATRFLETTAKFNYKAVIGTNSTNGWYYVYVLKTDDVQPAIELANKIKETTTIKDVWVYTGILDGQQENVVATKSAKELEKKSAATAPALPPPPAVVAEKAEEGAVAEKPIDKPMEEKPAVAAPKENLAVVQEQVSKVEVRRDTIEGEKAMKLLPHGLAPAVDAPAGSKNFVFRIFTALDNVELAGDVDVMDLDRGHDHGARVGSFKGNENVVLHPMNKSGKLLLVCEVFGYRPVKLKLDFNHPKESPDLHMDGNRFLIPFSLTRLKKGDIEVMYNVYFFKDAAVMRPESKHEIFSLLEMMTENPKYKIRIHGHTNGNSAGKIISLGESKKFFSLEGTKEGFGSAKKLSEERAKVIRDFLLANGIDPSRAEILAWGGKKPIHDKLSALARENVRVEVEILEE